MSSFFSIFLSVGPNRAGDALNSLPAQVLSPEGNEVTALIRDGQIRLHWDDIPVDLFLSTSPLHEWATERIVWVPLEGREVPVLDCASLAIFKAFFYRTQDWADLEAVARTTPEDIEAAAEAIAELVGEEDPAVERLASLLSE